MPSLNHQVACACALALSSRVFSLADVPGLPEPGIVVWGRVVNATNTTQALPITTCAWSVTDGTVTSVLTQASRPAVRVVSVNGESFYVLEVPFDTRTFGNVVLREPELGGARSFELKASSPPTYTLTPTVNGVLATVVSVDGAPASGGSLPVAGFNAAVRGRVIRVDLAILPTTESYDDWARRIFGGVTGNGRRDGDPDNDGFLNADEFAAGTNPEDPASLLRILRITLGETDATVDWQSVASRSYVVESATTVQGSWLPLASVTATAAAASRSVSRDPATPGEFYRIRVVTP